MIEDYKKNIENRVNDSINKTIKELEVKTKEIEVLKGMVKGV